VFDLVLRLLEFRISLKINFRIGLKIF
jgi:hypothetical protein